MKRLLLLPLVLLLVLPTVQAQDSLNMTALFHWRDTTLVGSSAHGNIYNEVWGFVQDGSEYAVIGSTIGTHIFAVDDPANAVQVAFIPGRVQGTSIIHRDFHDYNGYLYIVADEGNSSLQIADLSYLPDSVHLVYDEDSLMKTSHNIFIDAPNAQMYACGGGGMGNSLDVYSLANPETPALIARMHTGVAWWNSTIGYIHDLYVRNNIAYLNAGLVGFFMVDFTDGANPVLLGSMTQYVQQGYNHSGWLNDAGDTYVLADETHSMDLKIVDVSDPLDIEVLDTIGNDVDSLSIPHNLLFAGDFLYVSYYYDGVWIWNLEDVENPFVVGYYDTSTLPHDTRYQGCWGVYPLLPSGIVLVSDMQTGLWIFDASAALAVGTQELTLATAPIVAWPNPFGDRITISIPTVPAQGLGFEVVDQLGRTIKQGKLTQTVSSINVPEKLSDGVYFLRIKQGNEIIVKKLVKAH